MGWFINILVVLVVFLSIMYFFFTKFLLGLLEIVSPTGWYHNSWQFKAGLMVRRKLKGWMEQ